MSAEFLGRMADGQAINAVHVSMAEDGTFQAIRNTSCPHSAWERLLDAPRPALCARQTCRSCPYKTGERGPRLVRIGCRFFFSFCSFRNYRVFGRIFTERSTQPRFRPRSGRQNAVRTRIGRGQDGVRIGCRAGLCTTSPRLFLLNQPRLRVAAPGSRVPIRRMSRGAWAGNPAGLCRAIQAAVRPSFASASAPARPQASRSGFIFGLGQVGRQSRPRGRRCGRWWYGRRPAARHAAAPAQPEQGQDR